MSVTASPSTPPIILVRWLFLVALMVFAIVIVGGITRLTESGLSITEWKPISGALPPLNNADWMAEFDKYRKIPEYQLINNGMSLADFKFIYFWEWIHRQLGRLIGLAFALPLVWFLIKGAVPKGYALRLTAILTLIVAQGTLGWWMVSSGLVARTDVSHYRLAAHLLTALFILAGLVWTALDLIQMRKNPQAAPAGISRFGITVGVILFVQLLFGAYTAGLNAGQVANTWPLMNDNLVPEGIDWTQGSVSAVFNDPYLIHFIHRWWAWISVGALILLARKVKLTGVRPAAIAIHSAFGLMVLLGIATVMSNVNINVAVLHQAVGAVLVASTAWGLHVIGRKQAAINPAGIILPV